MFQEFKKEDQMQNIKEEAENKIIDYITFGSDGRLLILKPEEKGMEDYLVVSKKGKHEKDLIYLDINLFILPAKENKFVKDFTEKTFKAGKNIYLVFAYYDEPNQKINDFILIIPSLQFKDTADVVVGDNGEKKIRFEATSSFDKHIKYSKFVVSANDLGELILDALKRGGDFDLKKLGIKEEQKVNVDRLKEFLITAREQTYYSGERPIENLQLMGSKQFQFQKGDFFYKDVFFIGGKRIMGHEIVYWEDHPVFGVNYEGGLISKTEEEFLKESLSKLAQKCRLNGVCEYEKREYKYECSGQGEFDNFFGKEEVSVNGKNIYKLNYQGGIL